jgi:hypothetical protein
MDPSAGSRGLATVLDFGHDVVNRRATRPTLAVTSIIGASGPIMAPDYGADYGEGTEPVHPAIVRPSHE